MLYKMNYSVTVFRFVEGLSFTLGFGLVFDEQEEKRPFWAADNYINKVLNCKIDIILFLNTMNF